MTTPLSDFYPTLRLLVGDNDPYSVYEHPDGELDQALRSIFSLGRAPDGFLLNGDRQTAAAIAPALPDGDSFALVAYEAALLLSGGDAGSISYRTRALSVSKSAESSRVILSELRHRIYEIRAGKEQFSSIQSFSTWLGSLDRGVLGAALDAAEAPVAVRLPQFNLGLY